ncbi:MAG: FG-GAP-like repeat-containing protein [candidate division WOR-3 bacterium]
MHKLSILGLLLLAWLSAPASIPLPSAPNWTSSDNDYSTGGAVADIDTNGFLDLCVSNGNDMALNQNSVYLNQRGVLESQASWRSSDNGYFGHCYAGDIENDGLDDLAVGYLGAGSAGDFLARVYRNVGSALSPAPYWQAHDQHSSFDCCLGDIDLDGDLDLAISAGDAYTGSIDSARIYRNNSGVLDSLPFWTANQGTPSDAIRLCDIDNDGDLDLFVGQRRRISMYRNNSGVLENTPSWVATRNIGWCLRLAFGDYDLDGYLDLAAACNDQLGDPNSIKVFRNNQGTLDTIARFNMLRQGSSLYSSCVAWGDANGDGYPELAAGGWWRPVVVFENRAGVLDTVATWSWSPANRYHLVCEALVWTDIDNSHLIPYEVTAVGNGTTSLFTIRKIGPIQFLDSIKINGVPVPRSGYCCDILGAWVSFANPPPESSQVRFFTRISICHDLVVTNWDQPNGNHLFLNTTPVGTAAPAGFKQLSSLSAWPNPVHDLVHISAPGANSVSIYDPAGRLVLQSAIFNLQSGVSLRLGSLPTGVWFCRTDDGRELKLVRADQ